jgi:hypothetical protein
LPPAKTGTLREIDRRLGEPEATPGSQSIAGPTSIWQKKS